MRSYNTWQCPFCSVSGEIVLSEDAYFDFLDHLEENHMDTVFDYIVEIRGIDKIKRLIFNNNIDLFSDYIVYHPGETE